MRQNPKLVPTQTSGACSLSRMIDPSAAMPFAAPMFPPPNFMTLKANIFLRSGQLHFVWHQIPEAGHVGVPLASQLIRLNAVAIFALGVVAEIFSIPKLVDVGLLSLQE